MNDNVHLCDDFCEATRNCDIYAMANYLRNGFELDSYDSFGKPPLHYGVLSETTSAGGNLEVVKFLIANGTSIDICDANCTTALHLAARVQNVSILKLLLAKGANVKAVCRSGCLPIDFADLKSNHWIVSFNLFREIILLLHNHAVNISIPSERVPSVLHKVIKKSVKNMYL
ncbi:unnamed protein product [Dibothriocephalus latus]|uniref:Uncharacterized protein n=1 Tax=Dibothriocephalus latus TaxID=60516 RepID=A0A3P7M5Z5_DIBLA|nr:unnamed protein product [Dibothriocephalus latus]